MLWIVSGSNHSKEPQPAPNRRNLSCRLVLHTPKGVWLTFLFASSFTAARRVPRIKELAFWGKEHPAPNGGRCFGIRLLLCRVFCHRSGGQGGVKEGHDLAAPKNRTRIHSSIQNTRGPHHALRFSFSEIGCAIQTSQQRTATRWRIGGHNTNISNLAEL
jgi:hypothetical protein